MFQHPCEFSGIETGEETQQKPKPSKKLNLSEKRRKKSSSVGTLFKGQMKNVKIWIFETAKKIVKDVLKPNL